MKNKARFVNVNLELMVKDLNIKEVTLLSLIQSLAKKKGYCFATNEMLSESLGIHDRTLYRMLNKKLKISLPNYKKNTIHLL